MKHNLFKCFNYITDQNATLRTQCSYENNGTSDSRVFQHQFAIAGIFNDLPVEFRVFYATDLQQSCNSLDPRLRAVGVVHLDSIFDITRVKSVKYRWFTRQVYHDYFAEIVCRLKPPSFKFNAMVKWHVCESFFSFRPLVAMVHLLPFKGFEPFGVLACTACNTLCVIYDFSTIEFMMLRVMD